MTCRVVFRCILCLDSRYVTCGSAVKLTHIESGFFLHSGEYALNSGSGQQLVTSSADKGNGSASMWLVKEGMGANEPCKPGDKIPYGSKIRLQHAKTGKNLHSHHVHSPLTRQQEVTCYGSDGDGDTGDNWIVQPKVYIKNAQYWERDTIVWMNHVDTGAFLGSSSQAQFNQQTCGGRCPVMNHLEMFAKNRADAQTEWKTEQGVYLQK